MERRARRRCQELGGPCGDDQSNGPLDRGPTTGARREHCWVDPRVGLSFSGPLGTQPNFPLEYTKGVCPGDTLRTMVESWVNEKTNWHGGVLTQENWYPTGHYTQVVWRDTKEVGCGIATGSNTDYLVCRYSPGGNVIGQKPY